MVLDRTVQRSKLVLHGQEGQQCGADSSLYFRGIELGLEDTLKWILPRKECVPSFVWTVLIVVWDYWREAVHG